MTDQPPETFNIFNTSQALDALRAAGFRSTAEALFELVDNSIEAGAEVIEVFGVERKRLDSHGYALTELAVLDDGTGMVPDQLRQALRFGAGTRFQREGMGRYGVGLPQSSISQANRVDVWSWQNGVTNATHTYLSAEEIRKGSSDVPAPEHSPIPEHYRRNAQAGIGDTGTLVVWSDLHKTTWKTAATTFKHTEPLVGRVYRNFLADVSDAPEEIKQSVLIEMIPIYLGADGMPEKGQPETDPLSNISVKPNDPLFLMKKTSSNEEFGPGPMFESAIGSPFVQTFTVEGKQHDVVVTASHARRHARVSGDDLADWPEEHKNKTAGATPWGKRAKDSMGVSIVRAHRELKLDRGWVETAEEMNRWWTVEVNFPPALDEIFGVTNNKQAAHNFSELAHSFNASNKFDWDGFNFTGETSIETSNRMGEEGDQTLGLIAVAKQVKGFITSCRVAVAQQNTGANSNNQRHEDTAEGLADLTATRNVKSRSEEGYLGESDRAAEGLTIEEILGENVDQLVESGFPEEEAARIALERADAGYKVMTQERAADSEAFFLVETRAANLYLTVNTNHLFHSHLWKAVQMSEENAENMSREALLQRLNHVQQVMRLLLYSWGRMEDEVRDKSLLTIRTDWGRMLDRFLNSYETPDS